MQFKRDEKQKTDKDDHVGRIIVKVTRQDPKRQANAQVKGGITKTFYIADAKVSDVAAAIEKALFE